MSPHAICRSGTPAQTRKSMGEVAPAHTAHVPPQFCNFIAHNRRRTFVANPPPHEDVLEISHCHIIQQEYEPLAIFSSSFAILDGNGPEQQASPFVLQALALSIGTIPQETAFHHVARVQWKQQWHQYAGSS